MLKLILILFVAFLTLIPNSFSQSEQSGVLLYSQTNTYQGMVSLPSYENLSNTWIQIADDFTSTSNWIIDQIVVVGDDIDSSLVDGFNIYIYTNNGGVPGTLIYSAETQPYSILFLYYFYWKCTITLETPIQLTAGDYWISVQFQGNSGGSISWAWTQIVENFGHIALSKSSGTGQCASWVPVGTCVPTTFTDMYFELYGTSITPVELSSFSAKAGDDNVELDWSTITETNNSGFEIQRSKDGEFETIGFVEGHGTTTESQAYNFTDKDLVSDKYKYRLKQIDFDGTFEYSNVIEVEVASPSTFSLEQNYPNPFNPSTKIKYSVTQSSNVVLKIYDVLGNEVATLVNEEKPAGSYEVEFNPSSLTSGVYFYKLQAGSFVDMKKMLLLK